MKTSCHVSRRRTSTLNARSTSILSRIFQRTLPRRRYHDDRWPELGFIWSPVINDRNHDDTDNRVTRSDIGFDVAVHRMRMWSKWNILRCRRRRWQYFDPNNGKRQIRRQSELHPLYQRYGVSLIILHLTITTT